jgi:hypothetical protein
LIKLAANSALALNLDEATAARSKLSTYRVVPNSQDDLAMMSAL